MVNVLKEIGIQQWRRRTAEPSNVNVEQEVVSIGELQVDETNINESMASSAASKEFIEPIPAIPPTEDSVPVGGFSGSLKHALKKPGDTKPSFDSPTKSVVNDSADGSSNNSKDKPIIPSLNNELADLGDNVDVVNKNVAGASETSKKTVVPLNLSDLISEEQSQPKVQDHHFDIADGGVPVIEEASLIVDAHAALTEETKGFEGAQSVSWDSLYDRLKTNEHCPSCGWGNALLGSGSQQADWFFIADAPNVRDVEAQSMFCGRAGQLFDAMLAAVGLDREQVYVTSVFKCAPTDDLSVSPQCDSIVWQQIKLVAPKVIMTFGEFSAQAVIKSNLGLKDLRASEHSLADSSTRIIPTFSPTQMLNDTSLKAFVWQDLKKSLNLDFV